MRVAAFSKCIAEGRHLTTGQVANLLKVASRTVVKWFDSGKLRGYKLPMCQERLHRRIPLESLVEFLRENGMPGIDQIMPPIVVLSDNHAVLQATAEAASGRASLVECRDLFHLGAVVGSEATASVVVLDFSQFGAATAARSLAAKVPVVAILPEGAAASEYHGQGFRCVELPASLESIQGVIVRAWEGMQ